jgi:molybdopterin-binding protein
MAEKKADVFLTYCTNAILAARKYWPGLDFRSRFPDQKRSPKVKLSARNVLQGKVVDVKKGATTAHVKIQLAGGATVTASITNEAVDELQLKTGDNAYAVIKASDVMVAKD